MKGFGLPLETMRFCSLVFIIQHYMKKNPCFLDIFLRLNIRRVTNLFLQNLNFSLFETLIRSVTLLLLEAGKTYQNAFSSIYKTCSLLLSAHLSGFINVWLPGPVTINNGFNYFKTIKDDPIQGKYTFSHFYWRCGKQFFIFFISYCKKNTIDIFTVSLDYRLQCCLLSF